MNYFGYVQKFRESTSQMGREKNFTNFCYTYLYYWNTCRQFTNNKPPYNAQLFKNIRVAFSK